MSFKILHIEDNKDFAKKIEDAVVSSNQTGKRRPLELKTIFTPEELSEALSADFDLILADLRFPDKDGIDRNRLDDIIRIVKAWNEANNRERLLPIIAYTRREGDALDYCLDRRQDLFDIWDKSAASPIYAAWRLSRLAVELSRTPLLAG